MRPWDRYWFGPVAASRPYLLEKALLTLLAFDCWLNLAPRGAWYGAGGFNVPHFGLLSTLTPTPHPALYVGVVVLAGVLAGAMVLVRPHPLVRVALFGLYTYAWSMSMQDSYQHHYLLSLLLLCLVFFPRHTAHELFGEPTAPGGILLRPPRQTTAWAYVLLAFTCAVVYFYTAITKMDPDWRDGHALMRLAGGSEAFAALRQRFVAWGGPPEGFWHTMALGAIAVQLVSCVGYLVCVHRDRFRRPTARWAATLWLAAPLSFHLGVEHMAHIEIEWFSRYMIVIALVVFAPEPALRVVGTGLTLPWRWLGGIWADIDDAGADGNDERWVAIALALVVTLCLAGLGHEVDLPGAAGALTLLGMALSLATLAFAGRGRPARTRPWLGASLAATATLLWAFSGSEGRFDYYRQAGGDFRRRGLPCATAEEFALCERALTAYEKANRYAPPGRDRRAKEAEMRRRVEIYRPNATPAPPRGSGAR